MKPTQLMEKFTLLLEGNKTSLNELDMAFLSETYISKLIETELVICSKHGPREYSAWINTNNFYLLKEENFIEDIAFIAALLKNSGSDIEAIHNWIDFVVIDKSHFFSEIKDEAVYIHNEVTLKMLDQTNYAVVSGVMA